MTFLIAEDNTKMRQSIKRFLLKNVPNHHTFYEADDGGEAVQLYNRFSPDWVLMDIEMEPMDGLTASKTILATHPAAKIIVVTIFDDAGYRKAAQEAGTVAFVSKEHLSDLPTILSRHYNKET
jgi:DNA-binding NarL/FixJ family response regulator